MSKFEPYLFYIFVFFGLILALGVLIFVASSITFGAHPASYASIHLVTHKHHLSPLTKK